MAISYDIAPTTPLPGLHLDGVVARRFLVNYPVPPDALARFVPPGAQLSTFAGAAWVSACAVSLRHMRPSVLPEFFGVGVNYLVHRTKAWLPYPDGKKRESVLIMEASFSNPLFAAIGRATSGIGIYYRPVSIKETGSAWSITMHSRKGKLLYEAEVPKAGISKEMPPGSRFGSLEEADQFIAGMAYGGQWHRDRAQLRLIPETHEPWEMFVGPCKTTRNRFLERICGQAVEADHALTMEDVPHCFPLFGVEVRVGTIDDRR